MPRMRMVALGMFVLVMANALLAGAQNFVPVLVGVALWGMHLGMTTGVLASCISDTVTAAKRGTGFGVFNLMICVMVFYASPGSGFIWGHFVPNGFFGVGGSP